MKVKKIFTMFAFLIMALLTLVSAFAYDVNIDWTANQLNYDVDLYKCTSSSCSSVSSQIIDDHTSSNVYNMDYSTSGTAYHAAYLFKECYAPKAYKIKTTSEFDYDMDITFNRLSDCEATINNVDISDTTVCQGGSITVDANVDSAFSLSSGASGTPNYVPDDRKDTFYSTETKVKIELVKNNVVYMSKDLTKSIYVDTNKDYSFTFTADQTPGSYILRVRTMVVDCMADCTGEEQIMEYFVTINDCSTTTSSTSTSTTSTSTTSSTTSSSTTSSSTSTSTSSSTSSSTTSSSTTSSSTSTSTSSSTSSSTTSSSTTSSSTTSSSTTSSTTSSSTTSSTTTTTLKSLEVLDIECFDYVVVGDKQSCSVLANEPNADVVVYDYYSGDYRGTCVTDHLTDACNVLFDADQIGDFRVYATAEKTGFISDMDKYPYFDYTVLTERYEIRDLMVFNDSMYVYEDYDFYRGEDLYASFRVFDKLTQQYVDDVVTKTTLVSAPGGRIDLDSMGVDNHYYKYELSQIPLTHDFHGDSQVFSFAFNFADNSGGQEHVHLIIRNNPPVITGLDSVDLRINTCYTGYFTGEAYDLEDNDDLDWYVHDGDFVKSVSNSYYSAIISGDSIQLCTNNIEVDTSITLTVFDLDGDFDQKVVGLSITRERIPPTAEANGPYQGMEGYPVTLDASGSYDDIDIVSYHWDFGDGTTSATSFPNVDHIYYSEGDYDIVLTVYDTDGLTDSDTAVAYVEEDVGISADIIADPQEGIAPLDVAFTAIATGYGKLSYEWDFGHNSAYAYSENTQHQYPEKGEFTVTLKVTDELGRTATDSEIITVLDREYEQNDKLNRRKIYMSRVQILNEEVYPCDQLYVFVQFENTGFQTMKDIKVTAYVPELGVWSRTSKFSLKPGEDVAKTFNIDLSSALGADPGIYDVRVVVSNDEFKRVVYRPFTII